MQVNLKYIFSFFKHPVAQMLDIFYTMLRSSYGHKNSWNLNTDEGPTELSNKHIYANNIQVFEAAFRLKKGTAGRNKDEKESQNLFPNTKAYLVFGRVLGIIPLSGIFHHDYSQLKYNTFSFPAIHNMVISTILVFASALAILETLKFDKVNALNISQSIQGTVYRVWGLLCYVYFQIRSERFIKIFKTWGKTSLYFPVNDTTLRRDTILISSFIFISAICESTIIHLEYFPQFDYFNGMEKTRNFTEGKSFLYTYYWRSHRNWDNYIGYHPILAVLAFLAHKFAVASWNYVDVMGIVLSRALYFKFKSLCNVAQNSLPEDGEVDPLNRKKITMEERLFWTHIARDHDALCKIVDAFEAFLSPLIFGSYATNIYYVCMQLIDGLTPDKTIDNIVYSIFAPWSFIHLLIRMFLLSINAARVNTYAHEIGVLLKRCPIEFYNDEVARVDKHVTSGPDIGISGLGCFCVKKPFLLSIINVIFTVEIVLLQGISSHPETC